jgi:hypothetical protein
MQGHISSWLELTDSTSLRDIKKVIEAIGKLVVKDSDFECVNFAFDDATQHLLRYEAIYWDASRTDYSKFLRRTSRWLWPGEWLLFVDKRTTTFCDDHSTLRAILVAKDTVYVIGGDKLGDALSRSMQGLGDVDVSSFQEL